MVETLHGANEEYQEAITIPRTPEEMVLSREAQGRIWRA